MWGLSPDNQTGSHLSKIARLVHFADPYLGGYINIPIPEHPRQALDFILDNLPVIDPMQPFYSESHEGQIFLSQV